ncbi:hypothetical protein K2173_024186 [Erythroxylum novogranatense]|uniref:Uncharacterized protein n=1 Tax=Erythroxylum novogranatense TaxID=1862640 RepID=A0AAV8UBY3_9ROSI|nr:hypothetical protein K2173_024186 [Erythroxylum novogranatense]
MEYWVINYIVQKFIELEELFRLDEMIRAYPKTHLQKFHIRIHKETIQLIKMYNEDRIHTILYFSTNIIYFIILSGYSILVNEKLIILNSWGIPQSPDYSLKVRRR